MSDASVRWPIAPSANGCHVPPPVRVHASGPKAKLAGLEEAQRGQQPAQPDAGVGDRRGVAGGGLPAQDGEQVRPVGAGAQTASPGASSANVSPRTSDRPSPSASSGDAISSPSSGAMTTVSARLS